jgi:hypothetical protein
MREQHYIKAAAVAGAIGLLVALGGCGGGTSATTPGGPLQGTGNLPGSQGAVPTGNLDGSGLPTSYAPTRPTMWRKSAARKRATRRAAPAAC